MCRRVEGWCRSRGIWVPTVSQCLGTFLGDAHACSMSFTVANYEKETTKPKLCEKDGNTKREPRSDTELEISNFYVVQEIIQNLSFVYLLFYLSTSVYQSFQK